MYVPPKLPSAQDLMSMFQMAVDVGKLTWEGLQRFYAWIEEQNQLAEQAKLPPPAPALPPLTAMEVFRRDLLAEANERYPSLVSSTLGERRSPDRLTFQEILAASNYQPPRRLETPRADYSLCRP